jgi:hypothetical protein
MAIGMSGELARWGTVLEFHSLHGLDGDEKHPVSEQRKHQARIDTTTIPVM